MSGFTTWVVSGWLHLFLGFTIGWLVFKRPQWVEAIIAWIKGKVGLAS